MRMNKITFLLLVSLLPHFAVGQFSNPEAGFLFSEEKVPRIDITISDNYLNQILDPANSQSDEEFKAIFKFSDGNRSETVSDIGFRLRGNTSRGSAKKSFKVSFNTFVQGREYHGLEKMNLNGEHNDPSIMRARTVWHILRQMDLPAPRVNHVELYINSVYYGLYLNVEHIDEEYVKSRFGDDGGNLYKCLWPADLDYLGPNSWNYTITQGERPVYELKTNVEENDYSDLATFISGLWNQGLSIDPETFEEIFDVNSYLAQLAVEVLTGHWDAYAYNKNNFYLYKNPLTQKFEWLQYDPDNTLGISWSDTEWRTRDIYNWSAEGQARPLYTKLLEIPEYRNRYSYFIDKLLKQYFSSSNLDPWLDHIQSLISPYAQKDNYRSLDYGFTYDDFLNSLSTPWGAHVRSGIKSFISSRKTTALSQLDLQGISPLIWWATHTPPVTGQPIEIYSRVEDDEAQLKVELEYKINDGGSVFVILEDTGIAPDTVLGDNHYRYLLENPGASYTLDYRIKATDLSGNVSYSPSLGYKTITMAVPAPASLSVNEIMALNNGTHSDEYGEFDDWVEIHNYGNEPILLSDYYLSDNPIRRNKWRMPDIVLPAGEFTLFWADNSPFQGTKHTNFQLSSAGESIGIYHAEAFGQAIIDEYYFDIQSPDESVGRETDGQSNWVVLPWATPGKSNLSPLGIDLNTHLFKVYPNPVSEVLNMEFEDGKVNNVYIFDTFGREIKPQLSLNPQSLQIDFSTVSKGMYLIKVELENEILSLKILKE